MRVDILVLVALILVDILVVALGSGAGVNKRWESDCEKAGFHRVGGKVYECKLKGARDEL